MGIYSSKPSDLCEEPRQATPPPTSEDMEALNKKIATPARYYGRPVAPTDISLSVDISPTNLAAPKTILKTDKSAKSPKKCRFDGKFQNGVEQELRDSGGTPENIGPLNFEILDDDEEEALSTSRRSIGEVKPSESPEDLEGEEFEASFEDQDSEGSPEEPEDVEKTSEVFSTPEGTPERTLETDGVIRTCEIQEDSDEEDDSEDVEPDSEDQKSEDVPMETDDVVEPEDVPAEASEAIVEPETGIQKSDDVPEASEASEEPESEVKKSEDVLEGSEDVVQSEVAPEVPSASEDTQKPESLPEDVPATPEVQKTPEVVEDVSEL